MSYKECPLANEACPYWSRPTPDVLKEAQEHGCKSDLDHIVPQRLANSALASLYIYSPENQQQLCRDDHDEKTRQGDEPLPDRQTMLSSVMAQIASGELVVSRSIKRRLAKGKI